MKDYKYIFFDVDGTLINSKEGITKGVQFALEKFDIIVEDLSKLECFIGPPLRDSFMKYYQFNENDAEIAVKKYREYYSQYGINENKLYNGVLDVLKKLKKQNKSLVIATSKPTTFTEKILKNYDIDKYFDFISGATLDKNRNNKKDIIEFAINKLNIESKNECIMIGDRKHDIRGANINQIDSIGVLYGYGNLKELKCEDATYIVNNIDEILNIV